MGINFKRGSGLEGLQRSLFLWLAARVPQQIADVESAWVTPDKEWAEETGLENAPETVLEEILPQNMHEGHHPSLIKAPLGNIPNLSVMAYRAEPAGSSEWDQGDTYMDTVYVELMVKSPTYEDEELDHENQYNDRLEAETIVNRRIHRTVDAVVRAVQEDETLGGTIFDFQKPPTIDITDVFVRKESVKTGGAKWLWQMARLEWKATKFSNKI